jgi:hypothetical protein
MIIAIIDCIIDQAREKIDLPFGDIETFFKSLEQLEVPQQFLW